VANKEAKARIRINELLQRADWRFFDDASGAANISLEPNVKLESLGEDVEKTPNGFMDYLLLDERGFPIAVLEAKRESLDPLVGKEKARQYARSQNCRFVILSNGNLHYFWDLEAGHPTIITELPTPVSLGQFHTFKPNPDALVSEKVADDYVAITQNANYRNDWRKAEIVVSTVQTLQFNDKYRRLFSPTDFDLLISDEAHRRPDAAHMPVIRQFFKAYVTDGVRQIVESREFGRLADNPKVSLADIRALGNWRDVIPEYVKDYVPLNQFLS
jgi:type I site-specific restriction endonuclease